MNSVNQDAHPALGFIEFFTTCNDTNLVLIQRGKYYVEAMGLPCLDITTGKTMAAKAGLSSELPEPLDPEDALRWIAC
jgi:hypothetical protein